MYGCLTMTSLPTSELLPDFIRRRAHEVSDTVRKIREDLHAHPEIRFQEHRTAALCATELHRLGMEVRTGVGGTGVIGILRGNAGDNPAAVAFRAEMDALPMDDECGRPYQSVNPGAAHLCGHDGHVAALLGAAQILSELRHAIRGSVKFLFEPAEEMTPAGEKSGAQAMIEDGALQDPEPIAVFGSHFYPEWPAGSIALRAGPAFTGNDTVRLTIIGQESHVAAPHAGIDAINVAGHVITALQGLAAGFNIEEAVTMHFSKISGGRMPNLIAERVDLEGTFRISDETLRNEMPHRFNAMVRGVCAAFGAKCEIDYRSRNLPPVISTPREVNIMRSALHETLGIDKTIEMRHPRLAADTMFNWLNRKPGVFYMVGAAGEDPATHYPSHHQRFDIAPETWPASVSAIAITAIRYLEQAGSKP